MSARKPYPSETQERFIVRMPDGMRDQIAAAAKKNSRSMNSEIVARLAASFRPKQATADQADNVATELLIELHEMVGRLNQNFEKLDNALKKR